MARREPKGSTRVSRYCPRCATYWPATVGYRSCPEDGTDTYGVVGVEPIPRDEAERRANAALFEVFYQGEWNRKRKGPTPEELGAAEARVLIDLDKRLSE